MTAAGENCLAARRSSTPIPIHWIVNRRQDQWRAAGGAASTTGRAGYIDERRHAHLVGHRERRATGGVAIAAAGVRRAAETRRASDVQRALGPHAAGDGTSSRGVPAAGGRPAGAALE